MMIRVVNVLVLGDSTGMSTYNVVYWQLIRIITVLSVSHNFCKYSELAKH